MPESQLRPIAPSDVDEFTRLARASESFHRPWISLPTTTPQFQAYLDYFGKQENLGHLVVLGEPGETVGFVNLELIERGPYDRAGSPSASLRHSHARAT